jgi:ABC-2 type transport system permease protein
MTTTATTAPAVSDRQAPRGSPLRRGLPIFGSTLRENKIALLSVGGYLVLIVLMVGVLGQDFDMASFSKIANSTAGRAIFGREGLGTEGGFIPFLAVQVYGSFFGLLFGGALAFFVGSTIARNIENGMIELALSRPISRTRYYLERWLGGLAMIAILSALLLASCAVADQMFRQTDINWGRLIATQALGAALWFACVGIGMLTSVIFSAGRAGGGAALGILVLFYLFNTIGATSDSLSFLNTVSLFKYAPLSPLLLRGDLTWWHPVLLIVIGLATGLAGLVHFNRRDLAA